MFFFIVLSLHSSYSLRHDSIATFHKVYYMQSIDSQKEYARALHERVRREFPEVRILAPYIMCTQYPIYLFIYIFILYLAKNIQILGKASWTSPCSHVRSKHIHSSPDWSFLLLVSCASWTMLVCCISFTLSSKYSCFL